MVDKGKIRTFIIGGVAGALAGILLAPRSGKELRGSIASRAGEARERGRETYFDAQERARERISEARDRPPPGTEPSAQPERPTPPEALTTLGGAEEGGPPPGRPPLRDVSRDAAPEAVSGEAADDAEELRRRIGETRARLRERLEGPSGKGDA